METTEVPATGDEILDFLAWMWPKGYEEALPHYRALAERLKSKQGQFVLMIERQEASRGGCVVSLGPPVDETFTLGVLTDDCLKLERVGESAFRGKLSFPTARHAVSSESHWRRDGLVEGDVKPHFFDTLFFAKIGKPMEIHHHDDGGCFGSSGMSTDFCLGAERGQPMSELEFHVGDAEIDAWCRRGARHYPKDAPNELRCRMIRRLANLLGAAVDGVPALVIELQAERAKTLKELARLELRRAVLRGEIEDPEGRGDASGLVEALRQANKELASLLARVDDLGLTEDPLVLRLKTEAPAK